METLTPHTILSEIYASSAFNAILPHKLTKMGLPHSNQGARVSSCTSMALILRVFCGESELSPLLLRHYTHASPTNNSNTFIKFHKGQCWGSSLGG